MYAAHEVQGVADHVLFYECRGCVSAPSFVFVGDAACGFVCFSLMMVASGGAVLSVA